MSDDTKSIDAEKHDSITATELWLSSASLRAQVVVGAIYEPKIPPLVGD